MRPPAYQALVEKSRAACVAAVETYNRASAPYREENFAILMINAWDCCSRHASSRKMAVRCPVSTPASTSSAGTGNTESARRSGNSLRLATHHRRSGGTQPRRRL